MRDQAKVSMLYRLTEAQKLKHAQLDSPPGVRTCIPNL